MKKVLLVDDDIFFRTMFASMASWQDYGFSLVQADNGQAAIELLPSMMTSLWCLRT